MWPFGYYEESHGNAHLESRYSNGMPARIQTLNSIGYEPFPIALM